MSVFRDNNKARFNYEILEKFTAGLELLGFEVKAVKSGRMSLVGGYVTIRGGEAYLVGVDIAPYQPKNTPVNYDPLRDRKLLLTKKEINYLIGEKSRHGLTIVATSMYNKGSKIKVEIVLAKGLKKFDKREVVRKREAERRIRRSKISGE